MATSKKTFVITTRDADGKDETLEVQGTHADVPGRGSLNIFDGDDPVAGFVSVVSWRVK